MPTPKGDVYLSDLPWTYVVNGWGPAERDSSNGEMLPRDGAPMTIRGKPTQRSRTSRRGTGAISGWKNVYPLHRRHRYRRRGQGQRLRGVRGLGRRHNAVDTGPTLYGSSPVKHVDVDITGRRELRLFVGTGPNGNGQDHGDWANAMVHCTP